MTYNYTSIEGRSFRYSDEATSAGTPVSIQYKNAAGNWRDVRNVNRIFQIAEFAAFCRTHAKAA